jgi:hypothetical protein
MVSKAPEEFSEILEISVSQLVVNPSYDPELNRASYERLRSFISDFLSNSSEVVVDTLVIRQHSEDQCYPLIILSDSLPIKVNSIILELDDYPLTWIRDEDLSDISDKKFPNLESMSVEGGIDTDKPLNLPNLKSLTLLSSHNNYEDIIQFIHTSDLNALEKLSISASDSDSSPESLSCSNSHDVIWSGLPKLKYLTIGTRDLISWEQVLSSELLNRLDHLSIILDTVMIDPDEELHRLNMNVTRLMTIISDTVKLGTCKVSLLLAPDVSEISENTIVKQLSAATNFNIEETSALTAGGWGY